MHIFVVFYLLVLGQKWPNEYVQTNGYWEYKSSLIKLSYSHISGFALDVPDVYDNMWVLTGVAMGGYHKFGFVMVWFQKTVGHPNFIS